MKKINVIIRVTEAGNLSTVIVRLFKAEVEAKSDVGGDAYLMDMIAAVDKYSAALTTAIKADKASSNLDIADTKRDEIIRQLNAAVTGYANLPLPSLQNAATLLLDILTKYKGITSESYARESSLIKSLLEDLSAPDAKNAISALQGIGELVSALTAAQNEFDQVNDAFNAATALKTESASSLKKPLLACINDTLVPYLTAMNLVKPAIYGEFISKVENEITRANQTVAKRRNRGPADSEREASV
ncbi:MAG: hypothetical protein IJ165_13750 [Proteobacteria bacterium]|nr:hypothetical protein [Pseudomonadota bacterium]